MVRKALLVLSALTLSVVMAPAASAAAPAPYCGITWGSQAKSGAPTTGSELVDIRAGRHDCYDRLVFDANGPVDGYWVSYVDQVTMDGSGEPVPVRGGARLSVSIGAPSYNQSYEETYIPANRRELVNVTGYQTFRQAAWAGSWEGTTTVGLGVRARLPFRVFTLSDRVIVDVAHLW
ncbi:MAG TPA: hypothetical protein VNP92_33455 [Actinophytocola sp.]|nr:hypothetical protein [Actinophytocola sp.]